MSIDSLKTSGTSAYASGNVALAIENFTAAIALVEEETATQQKDNAAYVHPQAAALYSNRSMCYAKEKKFGDALADAEQCLKADPNWWKGFCRKAYAMEGLKRFSEAEEALKIALKYDSCNADMLAKLKSITAAVARQNRKVKIANNKNNNSNAASASASAGPKKSGGASTPGIFGDWHETATLNDEVPAPTLNSRKGTTLTTRPSVLDFASTKKGMPMFFPAEPTWPMNADAFAADFICGMTDANGNAPPAAELTVLVKVAANAYLNQKQADDAYRKSNNILPECAFCGVHMTMDSPPRCECGEPYCSRECMDLHWGDHQKICEAIRSQSTSLSMFHRLYWEGCGFGVLPWVGERVKNYSALYKKLTKELKEESGADKKKQQKKTEKKEEANNDSGAADASTTLPEGFLDENDVEGFDELSYLMLHERTAVIRLATELKATVDTFAEHNSLEQQNEDVRNLCAALIEIYMKYSYHDKKHDSVHRLQFKLSMCEMIHGVLKELNLHRHVETVEMVMDRFSPVLKNVQNKNKK